MSSVSTQLLTCFGAFLSLFLLVFVRDGNAQSCFPVCSDPAVYAALEMPLLVGNLGICKVSTITKAINLDTIMQSGEEEPRRKTAKATKNRTNAKEKKEEAVVRILIKGCLIVTVRL